MYEAFNISSLLIYLQILIMLLVTSFLCAHKPKPKRIKNLLKSVVGLDKYVANYVNINATPSTTQDQTRTTSSSPFESPLPQASQFIHQQTSQPQTSRVPQSQASQIPQPQRLNLKILNHLNLYFLQLLNLHQHSQIVRLNLK